MTQAAGLIIDTVRITKYENKYAVFHTYKILPEDPLKFNIKEFVDGNQAAKYARSFGVPFSVNEYIPLKLT
jgi:uncharacterized membrane protein YvbJ